jgi:hypothetical protein
LDNYRHAPETWPEWLEIDGFKFLTMNDMDSQGSRRTRLEWLPQHRLNFSAQVYNQLASIYRGAGDELSSRGVLSANQCERRDVSAGDRLSGSMRQAGALFCVLPSDTATFLGVCFTGFSPFW